MGVGSCYEYVETTHQLGRVMELCSRFSPEVSNDKKEQRGTVSLRFGFSPGGMLLLSEVEFMRADMSADRKHHGEDAVIMLPWKDTIISHSCVRWPT
ncbi:hypothetical protein PDIG_47280 [Penicillium digitatum PHI26]|uniref:Uncharacterized protein n=2 Tax=Penicillium digitatum TaxID=36651 RepID=K9FS31_PEND2|nr:hypothetical protein PDIP_16460 [Penicillium digitatum Pd1]EKV11954.1 hypothetical protein PDIG_47280 [Penicillium digitatum PHI26]EKV20443.1 hypothetical protein PDIP_16460 [Penicillium digitatum Pd1]